MSASHNLIRLGTRGSALALYQANRVAEAIRRLYPEITVELIKISTTGDRSQQTPHLKVGDKGLFCKEIEDALLAGRIDAGVHSLKDLPTILPDGLRLAAVPQRDDPRDALLAAGHRTLHSLPLGAVLATSSLRRQGQLLRLRPDLHIIPVRGNVDTRVTKLREGQYAAMVLAAAGLVRLGMQHEVSELLSVDEMLPAPGQGAIAIESLIDSPFRTIWSAIDNPIVHECVDAEREFSRAVGADCKTAAGAFCNYDNDVCKLRAMVCSPDGKDYLSAEKSGPLAEAGDIARSVAEELNTAGAQTILEASRTHH